LSSIESKRVAIITGGSRGIGRAVAKKLAAEGLAVVVGYVGNEAAAEQTLREIKEADGRVIASRADVTDEDEVAKMFDLAETTFGGIDVVVNAAGLMRLAPIAKLDLQTFDQIHRINVRGAFLVSQQAVRRLRPGGALVNLSSSQTRLAFPEYGAYASAKGAVEVMTQILARELRGRDVTVNTVAPGPIATDLLLSNNTEERLARLAAMPPLERLGTPEDAANVIAFVASPEGHWLNGQVIRPNGGAIG
jgi:3-oxoacyl-[acyl-carrier protein] reductase